MAVAAVGRIGHEERLSTVDHLEELRTRLIVCLVVVGVAFGFCFWQNHALLNVINAPLAHETQKQVRAGNGPLGSTYTVQQSARTVASELKTVVGALQRPGSIASMTPASATEDRMQSNSKRDVLAPSHDAPAQPSTSTSPAAFCTVASPVLHWRIEQSRQSCDGASCDGASCVRKQRAVFCKRRAMVPIRKTCAVQFDNAIPIVPQSQSILSRDGWS